MEKSIMLRVVYSIVWGKVTEGSLGTFCEELWLIDEKSITGMCMAWV